MPTIVRVAHFDINLSRLLGEGGFGKVFRAKEISEDPPTEVAAKQVPVGTVPEADLRREVEIMRMVSGHRSVIGFHHFEEVADHEAPEVRFRLTPTLSLTPARTLTTGPTPHQVRSSSWIFMEMATGGELFDRLIDSGNLTERAVAPYFKGMVEGLLHCHALGVVHRDIKLENVILCAEDPHAVKLVDFGLAVCLPPKAAGGGGFEEAVFHDKVGSKSYRAPEILGSDGYRAMGVDVWALGITVFSLVSGFFPLDEAKPTDWRFQRMATDQRSGVGACESIYAMYRRQCPLSCELRELLDAMLTIDPARRLTMQQVAEHRWFATGQAAQGAAAFTDDGDEVLYRSVNDDDDDDSPPFELPEQAIRVCRQRACLA
jgi:serine/threonine protein kinase